MSKIALWCETGMLGMKLRIWLNKIMVIVRIKNKDKNTICKQVYKEEIHHYVDMKRVLESSSKLESIKHEDFSQQ